MNADSSFTRVRVRDQLLPLLRRENPQLDAALVRLAEHTSEWLAVIDERATVYGRFPIDCAALAREPAAIRKRAVVLALEASGLDPNTNGDLNLNLNRNLHRAIDALVTSTSRGERSLDLPGVRLVRSYDQLSIAAAVRRVELAAPPGFELRPWRPGDRMRPARLKGRSRKLSDLFIDAKIPRHSRATARVVIRSRDQAIVWAEFLGLADRTIVSDEEAAILGAKLPT